MKPRVTIIVTVYRRTEFLHDAIASALKQTFQDYEILVTDDSRSSVVREICESFHEPRRIRYRANPQTLGIALNVRAALEEALGEYIAILNDDDLWEPDFLAHLTPALENDSRRVLAFSDHWIIREDGALDLVATDANTRRYGRAALPEGDVADTRRLVLVQNGVPLAMASLFRRDAVEAGMLVREVAGAYDYWLSCLLAASGGSFYYVPRRLTRYRAHPKMETARRSPDKSENQVYIYTKLLEWDSFPDWRAYLRANLGRAQFRVGRDNLYFNHPAEARRCFRSAFRTHRDWRPPVAYVLSFLPFCIRMCDTTIPGLLLRLPQGRAGLLLIAISWPLNWFLPDETRRSSFLFFPLWLGYILVVDALVLARSCTSILTRARRGFLMLFITSAPAWWLFELINWRTRNWEYLGAKVYTELEYVLLCTVSFSTVMPAVFETAELVRTFRWIERLTKGPRLSPGRVQISGLFLVGLSMLTLTLLWPRYFYPLVWGAVFLILEPLNVAFGRRNLFLWLKDGDWRPVVSLSVGALICGFFWELWNYYSYPKWIYHTPGADFLHVFEMPLLGYLGYLPFAWELHALRSILAPNAAPLRL